MKKIKYILIFLLLVGCKSPLNPERHPTSDIPESECSNCHKTIYIIEIEG